MSARYDVDLINPFLDAVLNVLTTMAGMSATPGSPYLNRKGTAAGDITGVIEISGYARGIIALSLSRGAILTIVNNMLSENYTEITDEIADAVGELTNMISGQARMHLSEQGRSFQASTPRIVVGKGEKVDHVSPAPILAIPFTTDGGELVVEVSFLSPEEESAHQSSSGNEEGDQARGKSDQKH